MDPASFTRTALERRAHRGALLSLAGVMLLGFAVSAAPAAAAATPITDCAHVYGPNTIGAAVAAGGSYAFQCPPGHNTISFGATDSELVVTTITSIDASGQDVELNASGRSGRIFDVTTGNLTLTGGTGLITLNSGTVTAPGRGPGSAGTNGVSGGDGVNPGESGGDGTPGTSGQDAPTVAATGPASEGGCVYVGVSGSVTLNGASPVNGSIDGIALINCGADGAQGGNGGPGGLGGSGGGGASGASPGGPAGDGGSGARAGDGGAGAAGGDALGGAIFSAGALTVINTRFGSNTAAGGPGGNGGLGGSGGNGGNGGGGGEPGDGQNGNGGAAGSGGNGGSGGRGGNGSGGAIYSAGRLSVTDSSFNSNFATGGTGGEGLDGEHGGGGGGGGGTLGGGSSAAGGGGGPGGNGSNGGNSGGGGDARGGAIYTAGGIAQIDAATTFGTAANANGATAGNSSPFGAGAAGAPGGGGPGGWQFTPSMYVQGSKGADGSPGSAGTPGPPGQASDPEIHSLHARFTWQDTSCSSSACSRAETYQLDGSVSSASASITAWRWRFDDGTSATGSKVSHSWPDRRPHNVTLQITDADGESTSVSAAVQPCSGDTDPPPASAAARDAMFSDTTTGQGCPIVVNDSRDLANAAASGANCDVDPAAQGSQCTLRAAIQTANARGSTQTIGFDLPAGQTTIAPTSPLPAIKAHPTIDGTTQPGGGVTLSGDLAGTGANGLNVTGGRTTIKGLTIGGFDGDGVLLASPGNVLLADRIGTNAAGSAAHPNDEGVRISNSSGNHVGVANDPTDGNVISGNRSAGVVVAGRNNTGNDIAENVIGTDATAHRKLGNGAGVRLIGARTTLGPDNIISGNSFLGVEIVGGAAVDNVVRANTIGGTPSGTGRSIGLGNDGPGVFVHLGANGTVIGGPQAADGNLIVDNNGDAIRIQDADGSGGLPGAIVTSNLIGRAAVFAPGVGLSNDGSGIALLNDADVTVGGIGMGNKLGENQNDAIVLDLKSRGVTVQGNDIRNSNLQGIALIGDSHDNTIGGTAPGTGNTISNSGIHGLLLLDSGTTQNTIRGNSITGSGGLYGHPELGIALGSDRSPTANDPLDADTGPNGRQNFPELAVATTRAGRVLIAGGLNSTPGTHYTLDFYASDRCNALGYGEGQRWVGSTAVTTSGAGSASFDVTARGLGNVVTATATGPDGTSEFSACRVATAGTSAAAAPGALTPDRHGSVPITVFCTSTSTNCIGTVELRTTGATAASTASAARVRTTVLGRLAFRIKRGKRARVSISLSHANLALLRRKHRLVVTVKIALSHRQRSTLNRFVLSAPKPAQKR